MTNRSATSPHQRAVVTGCAGFIGSHLAESLLSDRQQVVGIDCFNDNYGRAQKLHNLRHLTEWDEFEFVPVDLARGDLLELVAGSDVVYHLAAEPGVRSSWGERYEQYLRNNVLATQHLLEALRRSPDTRLVYASSSSVYGDTEIRPTPESERLQPRSPYGQTKAAMESLCDLYQHNFAVHLFGLRYFTVYGPRQRPDMAFHRFCRAALEQRPIDVFGDGRQTRDFSYIGDVVAATRAAAEATLGQARVFNIGAGSPATLREAIDLIGELAGSRLQVRYGASERGDVRDTAADTRLAREWLRFAPRAALAEGLEAEFGWVAEQLDKHALEPHRA